MKYLYFSLSFAALALFGICPFLLKGSTAQADHNISFARINREVSIKALNADTAYVSLSEGHDLFTAYAGETRLVQALEGDQARPLSMASADFNEDGVPDLAAGYGLSDGRGIVAIYIGNVDSIYPNTQEAQQRRTKGTFTDAPFLSPARVFAVPTAADFLGAGDYDADGHWDVVTASLGNTSLYLLAGLGHGDLVAARQIILPGAVTSLISGEINRADGLADLILGVSAGDESTALVYEGAEGALKAKPEIFLLPAEAKALALGRMDNDHLFDLAVGAGRKLLIVHGRDRRLSLDKERQAEVSPAIIDRHSFDFPINSIAAGDFTGTHQTSLALLSADGTVYQPAPDLMNPASQERKDKIAKALAIGRWPGASQLLSARVSTSQADDLLMMNETGHQLEVLSRVNANKGKSSAFAALATVSSMYTEGEPVTALPMHLNTDGLSDLLILQTGRIAPAIVQSVAVSTFTVNKTDDHDDSVCDSNDCTLREAINAANLNPGADAIAFAINSGVQTITLATDLPIVTDPVTIDATTQPGFAGSPIIEVNGTNAQNRAGFSLNGGNSILRGFVLNRFNTAAVGIATPGGNRLENNFIGTNVAGTARLFNGIGVSLFQTSNNLIGGTLNAARNLISGNAGNGIEINQGSTANTIQGNYIGTDVTGTLPISNSNFSGIFCAASNNIIGGTTAGAGNVISGNGQSGIEFGGSGHIVQGNLIGTNVTGTAAIPNGETGIRVFNSPLNTIGGTTSSARNIISGNVSSGIKLTEMGSTQNLIQGNYIGTAIDGFTPLPNCTFLAGNSVGGIFFFREANNTIGGGINSAGNVIAYNGEAGVLVINDTGQLTNTGNAIRRNSIFSNDGLGIDLAPFGVNPIDACDSDTGANNEQNSPILQSAVSNGDTTTIQGLLNSTPNTTFTLEFFANPTCDSSGSGEGRTFIGSATVTTGANCFAPFSIPFPPFVAKVVTATATDPNGNTSEFSNCVGLIRAQTIGVYRPTGSTFYLRNSNSSGFANYLIPFGATGDIGIVGDWDGDGISTVGVYRQSISTFYLKNNHDLGFPDITISFGDGPNGDLPIAGDWDGDGIWTIGVYRPSTSTFYLRNSNTTGFPDLSIPYGAVGDKPIVGDWDGNGTMTIGLYRSSGSIFYLRNSNTAGFPDLSIPYGDGSSGDIPIAGDWDGNRTMTIGVYRPGNSFFYLRNTNTTGFPDLLIPYGASGDKPLAGDWDGL
jgi:CSLREA domain-containing protein